MSTEECKRDTRKSGGNVDKDKKDTSSLKDCSGWPANISSPGSTHAPSLTEYSSGDRWILTLGLQNCSRIIFVPKTLTNNLNFQDNYNQAPVKLCYIFVINSHFSFKLQVQQSFLVPIFHFFYFILDSSLKSVNYISFSCLLRKVKVCHLYFRQDILGKLPI